MTGAVAGPHERSGRGSREAVESPLSPAIVGGSDTADPELKRSTYGCRPVDVVSARPHRGTVDRGRPSYSAVGADRRICCVVPLIVVIELAITTMSRRRLGGV